ncbi:FtsH protease activity modulator HflK [Paraglaciecola chathamensis]|jgi:membrane protease subunit HflK|uniref:Protein HflK n=3 Tax=Paraglaciecola chathamensis TaxID=368405 RepID=A0A8H9IED1_9ALTE|nr:MULTISPECIES: FtsH protease activity modulator HflK [Paraglaciecola]AEE21280.1 HflK protein [Glaciecola sp. 4H-3-7+YE-5]MBN26463.1 protease modulator HflK [Alteromonadaceae bacterium]MBJ2137550.1 FtsH protease activity modulator HflK [Paraglaciecola chathamensis]MDO6840812.1 FtsH protease activity modulator HflK [Paraglaciecola chathamensis]GAC06308.1 membrane protease subunit HflK [Paraglaciecola agarilytica NO2]|tara:strand:- start:1350 stop:2498 length:1149 start_codon:yes stop_codon:yes gene_type:complete
MAWNEPGGNNNDPWKNRGGRDQGPPDLDEVFKNILNKFGKFGGGKGGSSNGKGFGLGLGLVIGLLVIVWFISGFYTIREAERGVVLRFGEFSHFVEPGLRWKPTFVDSVLPVDVQTVRSLPSSGSMLTEDENVVRVEMEVQYRILEPYKYSFSVTSPETSLSQAFDSAIRYVVGHSKMDDVLTSGREVARQNVREELQAILEPYDMGISIVDMNFKDARPPEEVKAAFDDAIAAQEDEQRFINEAEAYSREIEPRARGQVNRMAEEAQAYKEQAILQAQGEVARFEELLPQYQAAPEVTRSRIYLETLEEVYSKTSKIMVDTKGSGNMLYLPLDKILERQNSSTTPSTNRRTLEGLRNQDPVSNVGSQDNGIRSGSSRSGRN